MIDDLTRRQEAVLRLAARRHPEPFDARAAAQEIGASEGSVNVTLRSLQRRGLLRAERARWTIHSRLGSPQSLER